jgi:hypothetical protein
MARRLQPTLIDYVVIAINPALIMVLIGSLVYFLLEMFYQGQYPERLHFCLTMFVFAAVLICRISIEEGWERALPFGVILALAICAAMHRFVVYKDPRLAPIGWLINYSIIAITWWFAYKLTWDCTLIDESQDASGEGLLQTAGLDDSDRGVVTGSVDKKQIHPVGTATDSILPPERDSGDGKTWWQRFVERRRRPHAPGLWVVYFSLAALPLFGLGQAFIPLSKTGSRRYAFTLLCVYVAAALGLLLTTSFLGLRRYLRQRRLEMPLPMVGTWLVTGAALIGGVLLLTALLPRPNAEYEISQLPFAGSEDHDSSRFAVGKEGVRDDKAESGSGKSDKPDDKDSKSDQGEHRNGSSDDDKSKANSGQSKSGDTKPGQSKSDEKGGASKSGEQGSSGAKSAEQKADDSKTNAAKPSESKSDESKSSDAKSGKQKSDDSKSNATKPEQSKSSSPKTVEPKSGEPKAAPSKTDDSKGGKGSPKSSQPPSMPTAREWLSTGFGALNDLMKIVFYCVLAGIALWFLIFHWRTLLNWLQGMLNVWRDLLALLLGRRPQAESDEAPAPPRHKSFADYSDPFAAGVAGRYKPVELVRYTFEAFEAWARDNGWPREPDQTVHDFARQIAPHAESLAAPSAALAEIYSQAAYSPRTLPADTLNRLRNFWQALAQADRERAVAAV